MESYYPEQIGRVEEGSHSGGHQSKPGVGSRSEPPPVWDGVDPASRWKQCRRAIKLWSEDCELEEHKKGVRLWRSLTGVAAKLAEPITDDQLRSVQGVEVILNHFDALYAGYTEQVKETLHDKALWTGQRGTDENMLAFLNRKDVEFKAYATQAGGVLPDHLLACVLLKHARLSPAQVSKVQMWLAGSKELSEVRRALIRLDSDADLLPGLTSATAKTLWQEGEETWHEDWGFSVDSEWTHDSEVYAEMSDMDVSSCVELYGEDNDVGYASDLGEDWIWVHAGDWQANEPLEEQTVLEQFASFSAVHRAKADMRRSRGWPKGGFGKGSKGTKQKGLKGTGSGPSWFGPSTKGSKKGDKSKSKQETLGQAVQMRDQRRQNAGMIRVPKADLVAKRVKCWTCGQIGHTSNMCQQKGVSSGSRNYNALVSSSSSTGPPKSFFIGFTTQEECAQQSAQKELGAQGSSLPY
eukprot:2343602-Amphidinium_carterae.2